MVRDVLFTQGSQTNVVPNVADGKERQQKRKKIQMVPVMLPLLIMTDLLFI